MSTFNFTEYLAKQQAPKFQERVSDSVSYFSLPNDGDEAIVRFIYSSTDEFNCFHTHKIQVDGRYKTVECLREGLDDLAKCPLCANGERISNKFFVKLIQYTVDGSGNITIQPKVWERPMNYAKTLASYIQEYGPLNDCVFKIKRRGAKGSMDTTYDTLFCNPAIYKEDVYKKDFSAFTDLKLTGRFLLSKNAEEMEHFIKFGTWPDKSGEPTPSIVMSNSARPAQDTLPFSYQQKPEPQPQQSPAENRPRRYDF